MTVDAFPQLADYLRKHAGINLVENEKNRVLIKSRLQKVLPVFGLAEHPDFLDLLKRGDKLAHDAFVNAMTTNTTHFWREPKHFEHFEKALPELASAAHKAGRKELRVWCAASSSGEEPYTLAMIGNKIRSQLCGLDLNILATDIDTQILSKAMKGVYSADGVAALPNDLRNSCLVAGKGDSSAQVRVRQEIRNRVTFAQYNLISGDYSFKKPFDAIFCRNVMIYFTRDDIHKIVLKMQEVMYPKGYLYVGHSETLMGIPHEFKSPQPAVYQLQRNSQSKGKAA
jgi:chemotaxis protein methyltransferase CheR